LEISDLQMHEEENCMDGMANTKPRQSRQTNANNEFHRQLIALLPKLRVQAMALTRNRASAEDLVQDAAASALVAHDSFTPDTNFAAWMHRILRNRFISTRQTSTICRWRPLRSAPRTKIAWC
jgi:RNA polymerase sigma factor (sigma-70 family)